MTVQELRADIVKALNLTPLVPPQADTETMNVVEDAWAALSGLVQLAEEVERVKAERDEEVREHDISRAECVRAEDRLDKALSALREIVGLMPPQQTNGRAYSDARDIAEECLAEIEGEAT